jgi:hypothetical protein
LLKWIILNNIWSLGLKVGKHHFEYQISNAFFESLWLWWIWKFRYQSECSFREEEHDARIGFQHEGTVNVPCDLTSEDFDLPIQGEMKLLVRFGDNIIMIMRNCWFFHLENLN